MLDFIYNIPTKIYFGKNQEDKIGELIKEYNPNKVLIHYGMNSVKKSGLLDKIKNKLLENNINFIELGGVQANPSLDLVRKGIELSIKEGVDFILAIGGGSVLDSSKAIANGVANPNDDVWDYYLGKKKPIKTLHKAAILTIASAGSEMSDSCVISKLDTFEKHGFSSPLNRFDFSICNPELTYSVNEYQTACGVVDIAMHSIERYFNPGNYDDTTDNLALSIIKTVFNIGKKCINEPTNYDVKSNMMWLSSLAHNGLTSMGKKMQLVVHQFEHEISGMYPSIAHGAGLAAMWCSWARYVYKNNIEKWNKYANEIWKTNNILEAINLQEKYYKDIGMPTSLKELNVKESDLEIMALRVSNNKTRELLGDKPLNYNDILNIYRMAYKGE